ncbi:pyridoxamine 5'-phosphate oxidase family protein [Paenibacillus donghaensis]|uniref:Pyridoxamine 5'-phosphate oxidase n=1 Tax=Paenibacillus donghaensis TaxID=414771 RepID=A0A2Z2KA50_9BACL|nr:pyridoxamine 5'-phosphate oxidase family protein [Paenibacillus donghaensis]ASA22424.1 pyridoxamine 5'-phosphate oxidase [Paenibacillus donghaensis]
MENVYEMVNNLIDSQSTVFVGSVSSDGFPNLKAMLAPRQRENLHRLYFTTNTSSMRVKQFKENNKACLYFCDQTNFLGVMLTGTMEVLEDSHSKEMIWRKGDTMYYPLGVTDPDYCVLQFTSQSGRLYRNFSSIYFDI